MSNINVSELGRCYTYKVIIKTYIQHSLSQCRIKDCGGPCAFADVGAFGEARTAKAKRMPFVGIHELTSKLLVFFII